MSLVIAGWWWGLPLVRGLRTAGYENLILRSRAELDLTDSAAVRDFFTVEKPDCVLLAAAKVGGIMANNTYPADFIRDNLKIQNHIIEASYMSGVDRLLFLGSSCIYPKECPQPIREEYLLTGPLEPTNRPYALAKIAGIEMCWSYNRQYGANYLAAMPCNMYGPDDNFDLNNSHVLPALIHKAHLAKHRQDRRLTIWGTGKPLREFLYSDDLAAACVHLLGLSDNAWHNLCHSDSAPMINIGAGEDISISDLARLVCEVVGYEGDIVFDTSKPDGTYKKLMDSEKMRTLGWTPKVSLAEGIRRVYEHVRDELSL